MSTASADNPVARPSILARVSVSPSSRLPRKVAHSGMVKAMIDARPAGTMLTP